MDSVLAFCKQLHYSDGMPRSITIRSVPDDTCDELAARAASTGRSLQEYLRMQLIELAGRPDVEALLARIRERKSRTAGSLDTQTILDLRGADRR